MTESKKPQEQTIEEKSVIFDILKFTPQDYTISIWGYGGDSRFLRATKEQYKYFKENEIDIEEYASSWDDNFDVPEDMQPFAPGEPYEGNEVDCAAGATMDGATWLTITDENGNEIFKTTLDPSDIEDNGAEVEEVSDFYPEHDCAKGTVLIWHGQGEKGTFFGTTERFTAPFDPKKLKINYQDFDGWMMMSSIEYDGEELYDNDYSTTGKWGETKWIIVGGEDELDLEEVDLSGPIEEDFGIEVRESREKPLPRTDWFPVTTKPVRNGVYECSFALTEETAWPFSRMDFVEFDGKKWKTDYTVVQWRGLTEEVK